MDNFPQGLKRRNKQFIINNSSIIKQYALSKQESLGKGIILINLLIAEEDILTQEDVDNSFVSEEDENLFLQQIISYVPVNSFWFKMIRLKIKKKYRIDIKDNCDFETKFLLIFLKDNSLERFSIYSIKL